MRFRHEYWPHNGEAKYVSLIEGTQIARAFRTPEQRDQGDKRYLASWKGLSAIEQSNFVNQTGAKA